MTRLPDIYNKNYNNRGLHNVVLRNLYRSAKQGEFKSLNDIANVIQCMKNDLSKAEKELMDLHTKRENCFHKNFGKPTYTYQRRIFNNYVFVYSRVCSDCGYDQIIQCNEASEKPEWAIDATERYYNNSI